METEKVKPTRNRSKKAVAVLTPGQFNWGKREFGVVAKAFEAETPEIQNTMIAISGMLQVVKLALKEQPLVIIYLVKKQYPELSELAILGNLQEAAPFLPGETLSDILNNIATHLTDADDTFWNLFWHSLFIRLAAPLTQWEKICAYAPYVYNVLVKPVIK